MVEKFLGVVSWIDTITKVGGWIVILIAIFVLFGKQISVGKLIYKFFKPQGIKLLQSMAIPFVSRDNCIRNARLFIEYIILTNTKSYIDFGEWKNMILDFKSKYIENNSNVIKIENTFILRNEVVKENIDRYFEFINENSEKFSANEEDSNRFLLLVHINNAYLSPLIQISSLQDRYNQDWSKVLDHYATAFNDKNNEKLPSEVASFYTWLMWGPSVCLVPNNEYSREGLLGLGDESMAVPVVIPAGKDLTAWNNIRENINNNIFGSFVIGDYKLYESKSYLKRERHKFDDKTLQFVNKNIDSNESGIILETTDNVSEKHINLYQETMFSAYIWIMLYFYKKGDKNKTFDCKNSTVLFEHANITDSQNVDLLTETLINKCISYLKTVYSNPKYSDRIYNVPWATNDKIINLFKEKIVKEEILKNHINFEDAKITQDTILSSIDNEFNDNELKINCINIDFTNNKNLGILGRFYYELYQNEFPNEDERESITNIIKQAQRMHDLKECEYHVIVAMKGDEIVGGIIGDYLAECNCGVIEFVVVDKTKRNLHIGTRLISNLIDLFNKDANEYNPTNKCVDYCFLETENPNKVDPKIKDFCISRLHFWDKKHAYKLDMNYVQMPLEENKEPVDCLYLALLIVNENLQNNRTIDKNMAIKFVECYFKYSFEAEDVNNIKELNYLKENLNDINEVKLERLI